MKPKPFSPVQSARKFSVWLDRGTGRFRRGRFAADRFFGFVGRFGGGAVVRGEAFFDGADTARKKCGRDEGGPKDGSADRSTGRTGGLGGDVRAELWIGEGRGWGFERQCAWFDVTGPAGGLSRRVRSVRQISIGRYFSRRSDPGRRRGAREAEWFEWALTVISMRPAGWPPIVMSKYTTGFDLRARARGQGRAA